MSLSQLAQEHNLPRVGGRPPLGAYLAEVWTRRTFIFKMAMYRIRSNFEANRLGLLWLVLRPIVNATIYGLIFGVIQGGSRPADYSVYVVVGVFFWEFFQGCLIQGSRAITGNRNLVQSLAFPRMTLPLSIWMEQMISFGIMLCVLAPILMIFGHFPTLSWLAVIPLLLLYAMFNAGVALIAARVTVHVTDFAELLPYVSRILFYTSGVLFAVDKILVGHPKLIMIYDFYPIYQVLKMARSFLYGGADTAFPATYWLFLSLSAVLTLIFGIVFFWSAEERYGRE